MEMNRNQWNAIETVVYIFIMLGSVVQVHL